MPSNRNQLATLLKSSKTLLTLGSLLTLASLDRAIAQDNATSPANAPTTDNSSAVATDPNAPAAAPVEALPPGTNPADTSHAVVPGVSQNPANPTPTTIPLFPAPPGNPISPYNSYSANPQSPQLTQPNLYVTGVRDVSQVATGNALTQAFSQQSNNDLSSEDRGMNYEHPPIERLKLGPFDLKAAVVGTVVADDNLRNNNNVNGTGGGGKQSDVEFGVTPAILLLYGTHEGQKGFASLIYAPTINQFYHESNQNSVDQNVALNAIYPFQRLTLNLTQTFTQTTGVNQDSDVRTTQESINTGLGATYEVDEKISLSSQVAFTKTSFSDPGSTQTGAGGNAAGGQGDTTLSVNNNAIYRLSEKLTVGPGINIGWDRPEASQKSTYEQGILGLNYAPTEKIGAYAQAGAELRQYDQGGGDKVNPIFAVGINYQPFDSTTLGINANQASRTSTAAIGQPTGGDTVLTTSVGAVVSQRIVQRVFVQFAFNYSHDEDQGQNGSGGSGGGGGGTGSEDNYSYRPSVTFAPTAWSNIAVYYQYLSNESNIQGQSYNDNQVGLSVSAQF